MRWVKATDHTNSRVTTIAVAKEGRASGKVTLTSNGTGSSARTRATVRVAVGPQRLAAGTEGFCGFALSRPSMGGYLGCAGLV